MKIRALLSRDNELFYPDSDSAQDLVQFYGILAGYKSKGIDYKLQYADEHITDKNGHYIFEGDAIRMVDILEHGSVDIGVVELLFGSLTVQNCEGMFLGLCDMYIGEVDTLDVEVIDTVPFEMSYEEYTAQIQHRRIVG